jgi:hypothetical protein
MKNCYGCGKSPPEVKFSKDRSREDGLQSLCVACGKERKRIHYRNNKTDYQERRNARRKMTKKEINSYKEKNPCIRCGGFYPSFAMDFDHVGEKKFKISEAVGNIRSLDEIWKEISKTELVCKNCHAIRTYNRKYNFQIEIKQELLNSSLQATRARQRRRKSRNYVKSIKGDFNWCTDCRKLLPYYALDYDHVRGQKKFNIAKGCSEQTVSAIIEELKKCELVCRNCHAMRTQLRLVEQKAA